MAGIASGKMLLSIRPKCLSEEQHDKTEKQNLHLHRRSYLKITSSNAPNFGSTTTGFCIDFVIISGSFSP